MFFENGRYNHAAFPRIRGESGLDFSLNYRCEGGARKRLLSSLLCLLDAAC